MVIPTVEIEISDGEPAMYLAGFDDTLVDDDVWPDVVLPRTYEDAPRKPAYIDRAARYLDAVGALDRGQGAIRRPDLRLIRNPVPAETLVERALRMVTRHPPSDRQISDVVRQYETLVTGRILGSAWVDDASLTALQSHSERLIGLRIPGPFAGSDRGSTQTANLAAWVGVDVAGWDWAAIRANESIARQKSRRMPRCAECGRPMVLGQLDRHMACGGASSGIQRADTNPNHRRRTS
jgi:hypothetical protein